MGHRQNSKNSSPYSGGYSIHMWTDLKASIVAVTVEKAISGKELLF
jgi:hypothetical protein